MSKNSNRTGYVKDWRQELDSDIWLMPPLYQRVWQWLKYQVNHVENEIPMADGSKFKIMPGQHLTSYRNIAKGIGWMEGRAWKEPNPKTIKKILEWLEKNLMITQSHGRGNREYTLITLTKWEVYQAELNSGNAKVTRKKQLVEQGVVQGLDINKNDKECIKNDKNDKEDSSSNKLEESQLQEPQENDDLMDLLDIFQQEFKRPLSGTEIDKVNYWIDQVGDKYIIHALRESVIAKKLSIAYVEAILVSWTNKKYTLDDLNSNKHKQGVLE